MSADDTQLGETQVVTDWNAYLSDFHARHPGITEDVLMGARDGDRTPYSWLAEAVPAGARILDLACGSGPLHGAVDSDWIGIDRARAELERARRTGVERLAHANAAALPFSSFAFDGVVCSMALMLVSPLDLVVAEIARVLRPGGVVAATLPASRPITSGDLARLGRLFAALGTAPRWPGPNRVSVYTAALKALGIEIRSVERRRFDAPIKSEADATLAVDSLYLPGLSPARRARGVAVTRRWIDRHTFPIPLARIVGIRR